jgi:hypothetical protein
MQRNDVGSLGLRILFVMVLGAGAVIGAACNDKQGRLTDKESQVDQLHNEGGSLVSEDSLYLWIAGDFANGAPLDANRIFLTHFAARDGAGREFPWKSGVKNQTKVGPVLVIEINAHGARGEVVGTGNIVYKGRESHLDARWEEYPSRGPGSRHLVSCIITPASDQMGRRD